MFVPSLSGWLPSDLGSALRIKATRTATAAPPAADHGPSLRQLAQQVVDLRTSVDQLRRAAQVRRTGAGRVQGGTGIAGTSSGQALGLGLQVTFTTLTSTQQVNTVPTSFGSREPQFTGNSTARLLVGGIYTGALGSQQLTFRAKQKGTVGVDDITFQVKNAAGQSLGDVRFVDGPQTILATGLSLSLSPGNVERHDTFVLDLSATVGSAVAPDNPFHGTGNADPNFDPGLAVTAGSFLVNGVRIDVLASDTLNGVLAQINGSAAGVLATFDAAAERVVLTQRTPGPEHVAVGGDSSGFLAATKLATATEVLGVDTDLRRPIAQVAALATLHDGTFAINGVQFDLATTATLQDVFDDINAAGAGARIAFDPATRRVTVTATTPGAALVLDDGTSGFFSTMHLVTGRLPAPGGRHSGTKAAFTRAGDLRQRLDEFAAQLHQLFSTSFAGAAAGEAEGARATLRAGIRDAYAGQLGRPAGDRMRSGLGIDVAFGKGGGPLRVDGDALRRAMTGRVRQLAGFLVGERRDRLDGGLLDEVETALDRVARDLRLGLDPVTDAGLRLDLLA